ncbi:MAG: circularly permuted type 2 ATP-grasp protein [Sphingomonadales bacterium]|nr:circularly permuted type 2 ATP-grasp protein [Sphingomonadales bacterium]MDE2567547.1 circularly permuted type 2 ATP-grasp protein [Sphingomonadales bacterium]
MFGPDPGADPLACYIAGNPAGDVCASASGPAARAWRSFVSGLAAQSGGDLARFQTYLDGHVSDLGLAFRLTGDEQERPWPLGPVPIVVGADEWAGIEEGLIERAGLLEAVIADIYGPQRLISEGHLPAAIVSGSPNFARRMVGMTPSGGHFLRVYAVDLARGPSGEWRVLADRARLPVGIGYALENRMALTRATGGLLASIRARRQSDFFEDLREGIAAGAARAEPRVGLLTPGRFNQSYPEQAALARHLGFSLVEGRDLVERDGRLFVRTIAGLKRIDAVWRWINTRDIDPLNFDARSRIGVPNILNACTSGNLLVANWPGAGVVESRAMSAFLPRLARIVYGAPLKLPNAATWWCGGESARAYVEANLDSLMISSSFRQPVEGLEDGHTRPGSAFAGAERDALLQSIARRPMDYVGQEIISLSTTPCLVDGSLRPHGFTMRAYLARDAHGDWVVLPGGLGRVSNRGDLRTSLMGLGDLSADVCVIDPDSPAQSAPAPSLDPPPVRRPKGLLPSQSADNLYWLGRYGERGHQTARLVRTLLDAAIAANGGSGPNTTIPRLAGLLERWSAVPREQKVKSPVESAANALSGEGAGSVAALSRRTQQIALLLRDRLGRDSWRLVNRPFPGFLPGNADSMAHAIDVLIERYAAFGRLTADTMSRTDAWRFLDLGIILERASLIAQSAQALVPGRASAEDLSALLDFTDTQAVYRSRYFAMPYIAPVLDIVLLDPAEPRGLAFQTARIVEHLEALPVLGESGLPEVPLRIARRLCSTIEGLDAERLTPRDLDVVLMLLAELSDAIGRRYFLQEGLPAARDGATFLA